MSLFKIALKYKKYSALFKEDDAKTLPRDIPPLHLRKLTETPEILEEFYPYTIKDFAIISGKKYTSKYARQLKKAFLQKGYSADTLELDFKIPTPDLVSRVVEQFGGCTYVGVGGGSKIDLTKLAAYESRSPAVSVPTVFSHDGISSHIASLEVNGSRRSKEVVRPVAVIADLEIIGAAPKRLNVSGLADAVSNCSALEDWRLAKERNGREQVNFSNHAYFAGCLVYNDFLLTQIERKRDVNKMLDTLAAVLAGSGLLMLIAHSSVPASGSEHLLSHALDAINAERDALHGEQVGVWTIATSYLQGQDWRAIKSALQTAGAKTTLADIGVKSERELTGIYDRARQMGKERDRYTILEERGLVQFKKALQRTGLLEGMG